MARIHPSAIVGAKVRLGDETVIGPYAVVEGEVALGPGCVVRAHGVVQGPAVLGARNVVHSFAVVGGEPQAKRRDASPSWLRIGDDNVFREHVTVHGGTSGQATTIGSHNLFMVGAHVAHDVTVGSHAVLANAVQIAGHAVIDDWATFGGLSGVAQRVRIGESAFVAAASACERDVPPFVVVQGDRARLRAVNVVGLRRRGIPEESILALRRAVARLLSRSPRREALATLEGSADPYVRRLVQALR